jgi:hypothetical protein
MGATGAASHLDSAFTDEKPWTDALPQDVAGG